MAPRKQALVTFTLSSDASDLYQRYLEAENDARDDAWYTLMQKVKPEFMTTLDEEMKARQKDVDEFVNTFSHKSCSAIDCRNIHSVNDKY